MPNRAGHNIPSPPTDFSEFERVRNRNDFQMQPWRSTKAGGSDVDIHKGFLGEDREDTIQSLREKGLPEHTIAARALMAAGSTPNDPNETYMRVKQELRESGRSDLIDRIEGDILDEERDALRMEAERQIRSSDGSPEAIEGILDAFEQADRDIEDDRSLRENFLENLVLNTDPTDDGVEERVQRSMADHVDDVVRSDEQIRDMATQAIAGLDSNSVTATIDFVHVAITPFLETAQANRLARRMFGDEWMAEQPWWHRALPGERTRAMRDALWEAPPEARLEFVEAFVKALDSNPTLWQEFAGDGNALHQFDYILAVLKNPPPEEGRDWDRIIRNAVGVLDATIVGGILVRAGRRTGSLWRATLGGQAAEANPKIAGRMMRSILDNTEEGAEMRAALGLSKEDVMDVAVMPRSVLDEAQRAPDSVSRAIADQTDELQGLMVRQSETGYIYSAAEKAADPQVIRKALGRSVGGEMHLNKTRMIRQTDEGQEWLAWFGRTPDEGFLTGRQAWEHAKDYGVDMKNVRIMRYDPVSGSYNQLKNAARATKEGEHFFEIRHWHRYNPDDVLAFGEAGTIAGTSNIVARYLKDPAALFDPIIARTGARTLDKKIDFERTLLKGPNEHFMPLSLKSKQNVNEMLARGMEQRHVFSYDELVSNFPHATIDEIKGYYAVRNFWDGLHTINNARLRNTWTGQGVRQVEHKDFVNAARPMPQNEATLQRVAYNPATKKIEHLTPDVVADIYANGGRIGRLKGEQRVSMEITDNVIIRPQDGTKLAELPNNVLNYIPGYVSRMYKERYFVTRNEQGVTKNGIPVAGGRETTVRAAGSKAEAERIAREMTESNTAKNITFSWKRDRAMDDLSRQAADEDILTTQGRLFFSKKGAHLETSEGLARTADPVEAMQRAASATANKAAYEPWLQAQKTRFMETFGDLVPTGSGFPTSKAAITGGDAKRVNQAKNYWDYINVSEGSMDVSAKHWRAGMVRIAEWLEDIGGGTNTATQLMAKAPMAARDLNPMGKLRALSFTLFLGLNPTRQFFLQSQQALFLSGLEPRYMFAPTIRRGGLSEMMGDKVAIDVGMATRDTRHWAKGRKIGAKMAGMTEDEYVRFLDDFRQSGLPFSIDSHMFVSGATFNRMNKMPDNIAERALQVGGNMVSAIPRLSKRIGFDLGEYNNLAASWLVARKRYMRENPGANLHSSGARNEIAGLARDYALTMTQAGSFQYQQGYASLATQFLSIQHKALLAMLPEMFGGSRAFSAQDKLRIAIGQTMLYGTSGLGLREVYMHYRDRLGFTPPPIIDEAFMGGLTEVVLNNSMRALIDDDDTTHTVGSALGQEYAPASGIIQTPAEILVGFVDNLRSAPLEIFMGASYSAVNRVHAAAQLGRYIASKPDIDGPEKFGQMMSAMAQAASGVNNYIRYRNAIEYGKLQDRYGDVVLDSFHPVEAVMGIATGVRSLAEAELWTQRRTLAQRREAVEDHAQWYVDQIKQYDWKHGDPEDPYSTVTEAIGVLERLNASVLGLSETEYEYFRREVSRSVQRDRDAGNKHFGQIMLDALMNLEVPPDEYTRAIIMNSKVLSHQQKQALLEAWEHMNRSDSLVEMEREERE